MSIAITAEQLRRSTTGGIGTYVRGLCDAVGQSPRIAVELVASRSLGVDPLASIAKVHAPFHGLPIGHRITARAWERGLGSLPVNVDVVHATSFATPRRSRRISPPLTMFVHDLAWQHHPEAFPKRGAVWHEKGLQRSLTEVDQFIVPSQTTADGLIKNGVRVAKITVVPEGCDHLTVGRLADPEAGEHILVVATLEPRKNLARLIESYARIRKYLAKPWPLKIVGASGWTGRAIDGGDSKVREALPSSLPEGVELLGSVTNVELAELLSQARAFAYVPLFEGFGLPPLEAMRFGVPVLSSDSVPSVTEASVDGAIVAHTVEATDVAAIAEGLQLVTGNDELRQRLRTNGLELATQRTWKACAEQHVDIWDSLRT